MTRITTFTTTLALTAAALMLAAGSAQAASIYADAVLDDNPVAYYRMNETSGTTANDETPDGTPDGTYSNVTLNNSTDAMRPTAFLGFESSNVAVEFDNAGGPGSNTDKIESTPTLGNDYAVEAWFRNTRDFNDELVTGYIFSRGDAANAFEGIYINGRVGTDKEGEIRVRASTTNIDTGVTIAQTADWHHLVMSRSGNTLEVFLDGTSIVSQNVAASGTFADGTGEDLITAGLRPGNEDFGFEGQLDELAIYDSALSATQVKAHYDAAFIPEPATLALVGLGGVILLTRRQRWA